MDPAEADLPIMRVHLGSDHADFELKAALVARLGELGHEAVDHGPKAYDAEDDYPPYVMAAAAAAAADPASLGSMSLGRPSAGLSAMSWQQSSSCRCNGPLELCPRCEKYNRRY